MFFERYFNLRVEIPGDPAEPFDAIPYLNGLKQQEFAGMELGPRNGEGDMEFAIIQSTSWADNLRKSED
jgi:hypothetical protein